MNLGGGAAQAYRQSELIARGEEKVFGRELVAASGGTRTSSVTVRTRSRNHKSAALSAQSRKESDL